jgi:KaiC/GvpD/RAD55 family RecA-like ATPase
VELCLTRAIPLGPSRNVTIINGITKGVHEDWIYKTLESAHDGIIDFKLDETGEETRNMVRVRNMRNVGFDSRWHNLQVGPDFEVSIQS